ncbi:MAG: hypothetical protein ABIP64_02380 [Burkholderiales bacterium]
MATLKPASAATMAAFRLAMVAFAFAALATAVSWADAEIYFF